MAGHIIDYSNAGIDVREGLVAAQRRAWDRLGAPGTWWDAATRIAIAEEARQALSCGYCAARKAALSPYALDGEHDAATNLPPVLVDMIHRIRTDASRLTERFYQDALAGGLSDAEYVETVGVMANVITVDSFCDALGAPRFALPAPQGGAPTRHRPAGAKPGLAWMPTLAPEDLTDAEAGMYDGLAAVNIHRALSLVPAEVIGFFDIDAEHYLPDSLLRDFGNEPRDLTHAQIEFLAARVSAINQCVY